MARGLGPVLIAVDFSPDSDAAFEWALHAALAFDASLVVVHVVHDPAYTPGYYARAESDATELEDVAAEMMAEYVERMRERFPELEKVSAFDSRVVVGLPVGRILEVAEKEGARMIVMGGRGRSRLTEVLLGSKVERVARLALIPVTIVRADAPMERAD